MGGRRRRGLHRLCPGARRVARRSTALHRSDGEAASDVHLTVVGALLAPVEVLAGRPPLALPAAWRSYRRVERDRRSAARRACCARSTPDDRRRRLARRAGRSADPRSSGAAIRGSPHSGSTSAIIPATSISSSSGRRCRHVFAPRVRPVAGRDYWERVRSVGILPTRVFRAVLIDRHARGRSDRLLAAHATVERIARAMGDHDSLIVFPEGTRGLNGERRPLQERPLPSRPARGRTPS